MAHGGKREKIVVSDEWFWEHRALRAGEMARLLGVSDKGVLAAIERQKPVRWRTHSGGLAIPEDWLREQAATRSAQSIANELKIGQRVLTDYARTCGIKLKVRSRPHGNLECPCEHELVCRARLALGLGCMCEIQEEAA
jgi:hypothetical protein